MRGGSDGVRKCLLPLLLCVVVAAASCQATAEVPSASLVAGQGVSVGAIPAAQQPVIIGLDADMSKGAAQGGEAIRRGIVLAIDEINASGGVLGRPLELVVGDHRGNPARGIDNINEFAEMQDLVAVVGGVHTPVALAELGVLHENGIIYLVPWAAGTAVVENGYKPNYVFRLSVRDEYAGSFLIDAAVARGFESPGLLLWRNGWGRSNEEAMRRSLDKLGREPAGVQWFNSSQRDMSGEIKALISAGADVVMLVANPVEGAAVVNSMAALPADERLPIVSHWGLTGGDFPSLVSETLDAIELTFLQTYSFFDPPFPARAARLMEAYCSTFGDCDGPGDILSPVGTAHAYDLVHILRLAIDQAGTLDRTVVRDALERIERYDGVVRDYVPPFTASRHDALDASDFRLSRYDRTGTIVPVTAP